MVFWGAIAIYRCCLTSIRIPMLKRRSCDHFIFNITSNNLYMESLYIETGVVSALKVQQDFLRFPWLFGGMFVHKSVFRLFDSNEIWKKISTFDYLVSTGPADGLAMCLQLLWWWSFGAGILWHWIHWSPSSWWFLILSDFVRIFKILAFHCV